MDSMLPGGQGVSASAYEDFDGTTANWYLTTYAICANAPIGMQSITLNSPSNSENKSVSPTCPAGKKPVGVGWDILSWWPGRIVPDVSMPTGTGGLIGAAENVSVPGSWTVTSRVICVTP